MKKILTVSFAVLFATAMCIPLSALAENADLAESDDVITETELANDADQDADLSASEDPAAVSSEIQALSEEPLAHMGTEATGSAESAAPAMGEPADDAQVECHLTITYIELLPTDDPSAPYEPHEMGAYVVDGLHPGDVVNVWDYVFNIPGHFFFDGSSPSITISADDSLNTVELTYGVLQNSEFTVDYYIMEGADLNATDWAGALAPGPEFHKIGEQRFVNQTFNKEVDGDDFEYALEGLYTVGSFPEVIHLTDDPAENVINVLYAPAISDLPESSEIVSKPEGPAVPDAPDAPSAPDAPEAAAPSAPALPNEVVVPTPTLPNGSDASSFGVPAGIQGMEGVVISEGNVNERPVKEPIAITDEMLANPVTPQTAERYAQAYESGLPLLSPLPAVTLVPHIQVGLALLLFLVAFLAICAFAFERGERGR